MSLHLPSFLHTNRLTMFFVGLVVFAAAVSAEKEFVPISTNVPQDVSKVYLPPECVKNIKHPRTMFTFLPNDDETDSEITVSTYPADLVTAEKQGSVLRLVWNQDVASSASEGGIKLFFPADQLLEVSVAANAHAQILNGFTNIQNLHVSSNSVLYANLSNLASSTSLRLSTDSNAEATVISSVGLENLSVSSNAAVRLMAPQVKTLSLDSNAKIDMNGNITTMADVSSNSELRLDGDLDGQSSISSNAKVTVYGNVAGSVRISSNAHLYVGEGLSGTVRADSNAHIYAPSCATVSTDSNAKCSVNNGISGEVLVDIDIQPFTRTGTEHCGPCMSGGAIGAVVAVAVGLLVAFGYFFHKRRQSKKNEMTIMNVDVTPPNDIENSAKNDKLEDTGAEDPVAVAYPVNDSLACEAHPDTNEKMKSAGMV